MVATSQELIATSQKLIIEFLKTWNFGRCNEISEVAIATGLKSL
ncbi:MAG: hypothetical protein PUP93_13745 [Rhizonema sp. NSF051]|nr:hypothetical protein [Rhizonema sp. NSF051]